MRIILQIIIININLINKIKIERVYNISLLLLLNL